MPLPSTSARWIRSFPEVADAQITYFHGSRPVAIACDSHIYRGCRRAVCHMSPDSVRKTSGSSVGA